MAKPADILVENLEAFTAFVRRRTGDEALAADVVQDALARALAHDGDLRQSERVIPWFYRILRNVLADTLVRRARTAATSAGPEPDTLAAGSDLRREVCACLGAVIDGLPPRSAAVVRALDLEQRPPAVVARELGVTPGNLKVLRHRARAHLHRRLLETCRVCAAHGCLDCHCSPSG